MVWSIMVRSRLRKKDLRFQWLHLTEAGLGRQRTDALWGSRLQKDQNPHSNVANCAPLEWGTLLLLSLLLLLSYREQVGPKVARALLAAVSTQYRFTPVESVSL